MVTLETGDPHALDHGARRMRKHPSIVTCLISNAWSKQTLTITASAPFALPGWKDAAKVIKPGSYMAKYDLRDGFWHVPVRRESQRRLV